MKIALGQINPIVGDVKGNTEQIKVMVQQAIEAGAELVIFPELAIVGYPPRDLLLKPALLEQVDVALGQIAAMSEKIAIIVGYPGQSEKSKGRLLTNEAAYCAGGKIVSRHIKSLLPTYDVFDEHRYFEPGPDVALADHAGVKLGVSICEDLWNDAEVMDRQLYHETPIAALAKAGAQIIINTSASPFVAEKHDMRLKLLQNAAKKHGLPLVYVNQVGGNDELIFDGNSCVVAADGSIIAHAKDFEEDLLIVDLDLNGGQSEGRIEAYHTGYAATFHALTLGLRDYLRKCGFKQVIMGLSGGIDSAVTCAIAVQAIGPENVVGITMPSRYSSDGSVSDAELLAQNMDVVCHNIAIENAHHAMEGMLAPYFEGTEHGVAEENIQARLRGLILMSYSNKFGAMLVTTGNKSELAVGYCTLYGDMAGGLAVISDVPKTMVYELAEWMNTEACPLYQTFGKPPIPIDTITKPPSAELRPDQKDQDSLPPYEVLDEIIDRYVEQEQSTREIITQTGFDDALVKRMIRLIDLNEYKRKQAAPGLKITGRAFGVGRRMPIAQRFRMD